MIRRILLVSPSRNYPMRDEMYPSGALLMLGSLLRRQGHNVRVVHMIADKVRSKEYFEILKDFQPDIVGFTVATYQTIMTRYLSTLTKSYNKDIVIVVGGPHPSALKEKLLNDFPDVDISVYGEGENAMSNIAVDYPLSDIDGICYRSGSEVKINPPEPLMMELDSLPLPDRSLVDFRRYHGLFPVGQRPSMFIMSSRGCPFSCSFCSKSVYGNTLRLRSPQSIMAELELLYRDWGVREIHFGDDTFNANRAWADELLDLIIKYGYHRKMSFRVALRVNWKILDMELLKHLKAAGVWFVYYGVENGSQSMLDHMKKGITVEEVERAFKLTHTVGIRTEAFFIIGLPGETRQTVESSVNLYKKIKPFWGGFSRAMPFPDTTFTREVMESGHLLCDSYDALNPSSMLVRTEALTAKELDKMVRDANRMADTRKFAHPKQACYVIRDRIL